MPREVKDPSGRDPAVEFILFVATVLVVLIAGIWLAMHLGTSQNVPANPAGVLAGLVRSELTWTAGATAVAVGYVLLLLAVAVALIVRKVRISKNRTRVDHKADHMATLKDVRSLTEKTARASAKRLKVEVPDGQVPGVPIGRHLPSNKKLYASYEDMHVWICGPRVGKSTSVVIPAVVGAPGAVLTTSNKRDVVDATRGVREKVGNVWIFDPQQVAKAASTWWWNPLSWLRREIIGPDGRPQIIADEVRAADLATHFAAGSISADAKTDAFFEPAAKNLLTGLFLAAALADRPITDVYTWVTQEDDQEPVRILKNAGDRYTLQADGLAGQYNAPDKQRGGVFGTALKMINCLTIQSIRSWVTDTGDSRPHFDPAAFVRSTDTLYPLSKEGAGSAGPLVTALTVAVCEAAELFATDSPGGRLATPLLASLDEAANVVRWTSLPALYSHYGSRGIVIQTILQSYEQGMNVWGRDGMDMLTSASNVLGYGGGVKVGGAGFLRSMSEAVGDHYEITGSVSSNGSNGRSVSRQRSLVRTLTEKELEALPRGRAVIRSSGNPAALVATMPYWEGPHAAAIDASKDKYAPKGEQPQVSPAAPDSELELTGKEL
ncbi:type IV secretory system conjugative DNA transfer family protein [Rhodococcus sp. MSC1_016]|jgi:type IV secretory pathway TraG/TraD family ATPase VirD4|uniref:type IV secretory system conjugative DNA transfer family protein n=1 Tax=Rhodococcus sp. MSC1_016 TaxID=2909266 RepID=UPI00202F2389|nr:TraM recognition domain-containing protein [Rhodococcus sp. MSC1_016]